MNILYDYQTFALQARGGISRYFTELIQRVASEKEAAVSVFMGLHINDYGLERSRQSFRRFFGLRVPELSHTLGIRLGMNARLFEWFARPVQEAIYHQTYFYNHLAGWKGKRVVTVYDMIYELYPQDYDADDPTARNKAMAVERADKVICISEFTRQQVQDILRVPGHKTAVVHLANSLTRVVQSPPLVDTPYLLYVGKRGGYKNFSVLLEAFLRTSALRDRFKLIAFGGGDLTGEERALIASHGGEERVETRGGQDDDLANLYSHASALVYPSLCEGFGMPPLEAMHYGCPVVAARAGSMPEIIADAGSYFDPNSVMDLAAEIQAVVSDEDVRRRMIARGRKREQEFSWEKCARETMDVYRSLL